jgi:glycine oxidase
MVDTHPYDVIVIGGGIIGVSVAYYLAKAQMKVAVLDQGRLAGQATRAAAGMLGAQLEMESDTPLYSLGLISRSLYADLHRELWETTGVDIEYRTEGIIRLAFSEEDHETLWSNYRWQTERGQKAEWLSRQALISLVGPYAGNAVGGLYLPDDHQVESPRVAAAFIAGAKLHGARFYEYTPVTGLEIFPTHCIVKTPGHTWNASVVVLAAGAWTGTLAVQAGMDLPVFPVRGEAVTVDAGHTGLRHTLFTENCYLVPKRDGRIYIGASSQPYSYEQRPTLEGIAKITSAAADTFPALSALPIRQTLVGLRPGSADGLPFIGWMPGTKTIYIASGHFRNGVLLAPATGKLAAESIADGAASFDLTPFSPERVVPQTG